MSESDVSLALYCWLCQHIVGSEDVVKARRLASMSMDEMKNKKGVTTVITSGSIGEGLDLPGSDVDVMFVLSWLKVHECPCPISVSNPAVFTMETVNIRPGFTHLRVSDMTNIQENFFRNCCVKIGQNYYFSSQRFKEQLKMMFSIGNVLDKLNVVHGPCLSLSDDSFDYAFCLKCDNWISCAKPWVSRSRGSCSFLKLCPLVSCLYR